MRTPSHSMNASKWTCAIPTLATFVASVALSAGCNNFLATNDAINNPNQPTVASNAQLLTGVEINSTALYTGDIARTIALFMNQFAGTDRQYSSYAVYSITEDFTDGAFSTIYGGGGLLDLRRIQAAADESGDSTSAGIARVLEAYAIGTAADFYGDVPYSTALDPTVKATLDSQASVYAAVQDTLDRAIRQLQAGVGVGPGPADLWYSGNTAKWTQAAYTLKARFLLHNAERAGTAADGTPAFDPAVYQAVLANAQNGISTSANNLRTYQSTTATEYNLLYQFAYQDRPGYAAPSAFLVNLMKARDDSRLTQYFSPASGQTTVIGSTTSGSNGGPAANVASFNTSGTNAIGAQSYRWPLISYAENQLIIAEANYRLGNAAAALTAYNNARTANGNATATALPAGAAGLNEIMTEKYITLLQNPEVWNDYKRTCFPTLTPNGAATNMILSRFVYPNAERNSNPDNIPVPSAQPPRNPNDPNPCFNGSRQVTE